MAERREAAFLNPERPPVFCPGCSHDNVLHAVDRALIELGLAETEVAVVSDIGCSGLFDTFFRTHAFHGLHGRVLTYAAGIKLARPDLQVLATMGDGGLGIGGAHFLAACRRNLDLTLLVLNNFNFGMTGGQHSATTPSDAQVGSGFLASLERPLDVCETALAAGAAFAVRCSAYQADLPEILARAVRFPGFSVVDVHGICPGRYGRRNRITRASVEAALAARPPCTGEVPGNRRPEFGAAYREQAARETPLAAPAAVRAHCSAPFRGREGVLLLGSAGQRVVTAGEVLGLAGLAAGLHVTQKSEYNITVLRGPSITELILAEEPIDYTGIDRASVVLALAAEGVERRADAVRNLPGDALVLRAADVQIPETRARVVTWDWKGQGVRRADVGLAAVGALARAGRVLTAAMLDAGLAARFAGETLAAARRLVAV